MAGYSFVNEAGTGLDLNDLSDYRIVERGITGLGLQALQLRSESRARRAGSELRTARIPARQVTLPVLVLGSSHADMLDNQNALIKHVAGSYGRATPRPGFFVVDTANNAARRLRCIAQAVPVNYGGVQVPTRSLVEIRFFADHPFFYLNTEQTTTITIGTGSTPSWPFTWPVTWGLDGFSGGVTVNNAGDTETRSLLWSVPGPVTSPALNNQTTGTYVRFPDLVVPTGLTFKVRMGWRPDGVTEHKAVMESPDGTETNVLGKLDNGSTFFHLEPGNNVLNATQDSPESGTVHTLGWYHEYFTP
jgi:hypothetical protein